MHKYWSFLIFACPAIAQTVVSVDNLGNITATGSLSAISVATEGFIASGTYVSGLTFSGTPPGSCAISFPAPGGGAAASASVVVNSGGVIQSQLSIVSPGAGYTTGPTTASVNTGQPNCSGTSLVVTTALGGAIDLLNGVHPTMPSGGHGRIWFDSGTGGTDWPLTVPMGVDQGNNYSAMVRMNSGTAVGAYAPYYWGVGGATPTATWMVYDNTASTFPVTPGGSYSVTLTASGAYTPTTANIYCVLINSTGANFTWGGVPWGSTPSCTTYGPFAMTTSGSPTALGSTGLSVYFSATSGTSGQNWTIAASPGGNTTAVIQAGIGQSGNLLTIENNAATPLWTISANGSMAGTLASAVPPSSTTGGGTAASDVLDLTAAAGGACIPASPCTGGNGGGASWTLGAGGAASPTSGAGTGGIGGSLSLTAGAGGGSGGASAGMGGVGGAITLAAGAGGAGTASNSSGGGGGAVTISSGIGGLANGTGANADGGLITINGGDQAGTAGAVSGQVLVRGGNNAANSTSTQAGGVEILAGASTSSSSQGLQGLLTLQAVYVTGATVTQWHIECVSTSMVAHDCGVANSANFVGVAEQSGSGTSVQVVIGGQVPIVATAAVTVGHTVCSGGSGHPSEVTDSGGTGACGTPGTTVGIVLATSGTWIMPDGTNFMAGTTLPLVQLAHF